MNILVGLLAAIAGLFAVLFAKKNTELTLEKSKGLDNKEENTAKKLVAAQLLTKDAKADYDKAMADLPSDYKPPGGR